MDVIPEDVGTYFVGGFEWFSTARKQNLLFCNCLFEVKTPDYIKYYLEISTHVSRLIHEINLNYFIYCHEVYFPCALYVIKDDFM